MPDVFFIGDTHFSHKRIFEFEPEHNNLTPISYEDLKKKHSILERRA
jgi:hypothetical protein